MIKTKQLQQLWWDWLGTSERLLRSLHEQTTALVRRDVTLVERLQPELDSMLEHMKDVDDRAAAAARKLAGDLGVEPSLRSLVAALPEAEAQQVQSIANRVKAASLNVQNLLDKNRQLIQNELLYTSGTLALIAKAAQENQAQYGGSQDQVPVLVDQVA